MKIGIYINAQSKYPIDVVVVYDFEKWQDFILSSRYGSWPHLQREPTSTELHHFTGDSQVPIFHYDNWEDLIEEELMSGASDTFLHGILDLARELRQGTLQLQSPQLLLAQ